MHKNKPILISGSFAYDTIMQFDGKFSEHILPQQIHKLNVCFLAHKLRREFGGTAGNIAYNLKLLGGDPLPIGAVGTDFAPYRDYLTAREIDASHLREIPAAYTAQAFITTDAAANQITAFHPGAMQAAHQVEIPAADFALGIVAPNGKQAMLDHAAQLHTAGIAFIFDPGQGLQMFSGDELRDLIARAKYAIVNDYEAEMLRQKCALTNAAIAAKLDAFIITRGARGADIFHNGECLHIAAVAAKAVDPTGCGDAFRAGLLYGLARELPWRECGQIAATIAAIKVAHHGTQNHSITTTELAAQYTANFGAEFPC